LQCSLRTVLRMSIQKVHHTKPDVLTARRDIAVRLRTLRLRAGLTGKDLAQRLGCDPSKVSRIENATATPSVPDIRAWCTVCNAKDQEEDLVAASVAADQAYATWRTEQRGGLLRLQTEMDDLYTKMKRVRGYESRVIPGLLQTEDYSTVILNSLRRKGTPDDVREAVAYRYGMRRFLHSGSTFAYLIEESVLHSRIADDEIMRAQLDHLIADTRLPRVSIGVIPLGVRRAQWPVEAFRLYDENLIRVSLVSGRWSAKTPGDFADYLTTFENLSEIAVVGDEARDLIRQAAG
jgi:transcriptional regulator with XRE-family HTH domain